MHTYKQSHSKKSQKYNHFLKNANVLALNAITKMHTQNVHFSQNSPHLDRNYTQFIVCRNTAA